ncbi:MAG: hypothetical protein ABL958_05855 [Bdellovibrionia bacterium]
MSKILAIFALILPLAAQAQRVTDSSSIFDCTYKSREEAKAAKSPSLCNDLLEQSTKDKGTLLLRAEILRLLDAGYFPVSDVVMKTVGPYLGYSLRQVEGQIEFSRDFKPRVESEIVVVSFAGLLNWNQDGGWFFLDKPVKKRLVPKSPTVGPLALR